MPLVPEGDGSDPRVAAMYAEAAAALRTGGRVPNILRAATADPEIAAWFWEGVKVLLLRESSIPRALKESIAVAVSGANSCGYCAEAHGALLRLLGVPAAEVADLRAGRLGSLAPAGRAAVAFALRANAGAHRVARADHDELRAHGYGDRQIVEIAAVAAAFAMANVLAGALGTDPEPGAPGPGAPGPGAPGRG